MGLKDLGRIGSYIDAAAQTDMLELAEATRVWALLEREEAFPIGLLLSECAGELSRSRSWSAGTADRVKLSKTAPGLVVFTGRKSGELSGEF